MLLINLCYNIQMDKLFNSKTWYQHDYFYHLNYYYFSRSFDLQHRKIALGVNCYYLRTTI